MANEMMFKRNGRTYKLVKDGSETIECGLRVLGRASRLPWTWKRRIFGLYFRRWYKPYIPRNNATKTIVPVPQASTCDCWRFLFFPQPAREETTNTKRILTIDNITNTKRKPCTWCNWGERATLGKKTTVIADNLNQNKQIDFWVPPFYRASFNDTIGTFRIFDDNCRKDVTRQILRATKGHPQPYVQSSRPTGQGRNATNHLPQQTYLYMIIHLNHGWIYAAKDCVFGQWRKPANGACLLCALWQNQIIHFLGAWPFCSTRMCVPGWWRVRLVASGMMVHLVGNGLDVKYRKY